ncbi:MULTISPECIES: hypothetical protein [unclassified Nostoc]|uniref:hypothetical protein n=1 Tax=unclassified Nostoc TaxID=2593658 RepID=UPI002AD3188A|nr:hypothetical protein [Nostoc sp. ChiQUE02]MDZ8234303.1 hypothetical protein [Nostoc sp. ChiQUE02]
MADDQLENLVMAIATAKILDIINQNCVSGANVPLRGSKLARASRREVIAF